MRNKRDAVIRIVSDDDDEIPDGRSVRVPMVLMDSMAGHRPGYVQLTDEQVAMRREARDAMIRRAENAWRTRPACDAAEPDLGSRPEEVMRRHLRGKPDDDGAPDRGDIRAVERRRLTERGAEAQRERDAAWAQYKGRLSGAWRNPAAAAERNETQLEAWRKPGARPGLHQDVIKDSAAAYAAYVERIGRAWRAT
jgi:hypothetical protein